MLNKTFWFSDVTVELVSIALVDRTVTLTTNVANRGLNDQRMLRVLNDLPVVLEGPSGSVSLAKRSTPAGSVGVVQPLRFEGFGPPGISLAGATVRFGDSTAAAAVSVNIGAEPIGGPALRRGFVEGTASMRIQSTASSYSDVTIEVIDSLLRAQTRPGTTGRFDLQLKVRARSTAAVPASAGANISPDLFSFNGKAATCCTDLTSLIYTLPVNSAPEGWMKFDIDAVPSTGAVLAVNAGGAPVPILLTIVA
jgi:hypothetical protein